MRQADVAIVGGGLAGSTAAAMLGRAGIDTVLVEPHAVHPPELRCEKLCGPQVDMLRRTGLAEAVLPATTHDREIWIARFGRLLEKRPGAQHGIRYDALVNAMRAAIPPRVTTLHHKAVAIAAGNDRQQLTLASGETISARLVVLANGQSISLRDQLGIGREVLSACHSVSLGFDVAPRGRDTFAFRALTYFAEATALRTAYLTLFPIGDGMRGNLFVYRDAADPWLRQFRRTPEAMLDQCLPRLRRMIGDYEIHGDIRVRPADLYVSTGHRQAGVVLVGDAFQAPCPGSGTGTSKVFTDVAQLCAVHIPRWLASDGMGADKVAAYYDDPEKRACDAFALDEAWRLRSLTLETTPYWTAQRWLRFLARFGRGRATALATLLGFRDGPARIATAHGDEHARDILRALGILDPETDSATRHPASPAEATEQR